LVRRFVGYPTALDDERKIIRFLVLGGPVSCLVNTTLGVTSLFFAGHIPLANYLFKWATWWVGDTIGALIFTPLVLIWTVSPRPSGARRQVFVTLPLCLTFTLAVTFFVYASRWEQKRIRLEFEQQTESLAQALVSNLNGYVDVLHSVEGLCAAAPDVDRRGFHRFVKHLLSRYPGIQALSWDLRVPDSERAAYEESVRREGYNDFRITERTAQGQMVRAARRAEYVPVRYIEPYLGNETGLGFDVASDPTRFEALTRARDSEKPVATGRILLVQDTAQQFGFGVYLPFTRPAYLTRQ
jgi:hypothetical protein